MLPIIGIWQGAYGADGSLEATPGWTPQPGCTYVIMAQSTVATDDNKDYTVGVEYILANDLGPLMSQQAASKVSSGGPSTAPMCYIMWPCPQDYVGGDVNVVASAVGHSPKLNSSCCFSIVVVQIEQPEPEG